jgi:hypothetical protein
LPYIEVSALNSSNIELAFKQLIVEIYSKKNKLHGDTEDKKPTGEIIGDGNALKINSGNKTKTHKDIYNEYRDKNSCTC